MSTYKPFTTSDVVVTPFKVNKSFTFTGASEITASDIGIDRFIGKNIYNKKIYNYVCQSWSEKNPEISGKYSNILLKYREVR